MDHKEKAYNYAMQNVGEFLRRCFIFKSCLPDNMDMLLPAPDDPLCTHNQGVPCVGVEIVSRVPEESWRLVCWFLENQYCLEYTPFNNSLLWKSRVGSQEIYEHDIDCFFEAVRQWTTKWLECYGGALKPASELFERNWYLELMNNADIEIRELCE